MVTSGDVRLLAFCVSLLCLGGGRGVIGDTSMTEEFQVTEVSLERTDQGFVVTLHCRGASQLTSGNVRVKEGTAPLPLTLGQIGEGVIVFQTPKVKKEGEDVSPLYPLVTLYLPHRYHSLSLRLLPLPRLRPLPLSHHSLPLFNLKVEPGYDVTFEPGSDIDLTVTTRFGGGDDAGTSSFETALYRKSALREDVVVLDSHDDDHLLKEADQAGWGGNQYRRYTVRTSALREGEGEGAVLELTSTVLFSCPESACAVQGYSVTAHVILRPDHRPGPFPDHFVGWVRGPRAEEGEDARTDLFCSLHREGGAGGRGYLPQRPSPTCSFSCQFMGDRPSPVRVVKLRSPSSALRPLPAYYSSAPFAHWSSGVMTFDDVTEDIAGVYQCRSRSGAREATHTISVSVGLDARINTELSNVTFLDDGRVEARCVAEGSPAPAIQIRETRDSPHHVTPSLLRDVTVTRPRDATSVAVARVHEDRDATTGRLRGFTCVAANNIGGTEYEDQVPMLIAYPGSDNPVTSYYLEHYAGVRVFRP